MAYSKQLFAPPAPAPCSGQPKKTIAETRAALDAGSRSRSYWCDSLILSRLAEAALAAGDPASTGAALQEAFAFVEQSGERFWLADLHRVDGDIALKRPEPDRARAEACFLKAIDTARCQEARILELRAAIDLARLRRETGRPMVPALCWSRSSRRSRAARPRGKRPQRPRATSGDRLN
jgi:predicted ATPase